MGHNRVGLFLLLALVYIPFFCPLFTSPCFCHLLASFFFFRALVTRTCLVVITVQASGETWRHSSKRSGVSISRFCLPELRVIVRFVLWCRYACSISDITYRASASLLANNSLDAYSMPPTLQTLLSAIFRLLFFCWSLSDQCWFCW